MAVDAALFVSKRASVAAAALLCLMAGRLVAPPPVGLAPAGARVAIGVAAAQIEPDRS